MTRRLPLILLLALFLSAVQAQNESDAPELEIGVVEKLGDYIPEHIEIINEEGERVNLRSLITKPSILNFVYYRCPGICSPLMSGIAEVISRSDLELVEDYQVLTISFDPSEGRELATKKRGNYLSQLTREVNTDGWQFFVADSANIADATNAAGFKYKRTGNDFLHSATLIVVSPDGMITRYLNGTYFLPFDLKMSILEASRGQISTTINKVLQYCYSFDPDGQRYVLNVTRVAGTLILFFAAIILAVLLLKPRIRQTPKQS
jgi:protein SCO1/2